MPPRASAVAVRAGASLSTPGASPGAGAPGPAARVLLLFRNDLRLHDNAAVAAAAAAAKGGGHVVPVVCIDPRLLSRTAAGHRRLGAFRAAFLLESLADLRESLRQRHGAELLVLRGTPAAALPPLFLPPSEGATLVVAAAEAASEELADEKALAKKCSGSVALRLLWSSTLLAPEDLPFDPATSAMPSVFTPFRNAVEARTVPRKPLAELAAGALPPPPRDGPRALPAAVAAAAAAPLPALTDLGFSAEEAAMAEAPADRGNGLRFRGGETAALARLKHYLWDTDAIGTYFDTRNGLAGADYSSKLSPWLALGCLSPRLIAAELARYEASRLKNKSTYWLLFELLWRDFFRFLFVRHGAAMFYRGGFLNDTWRWRTLGDASAAADFAAWKAGRTGWPLVDANMRELAATGFMSNRGRQNVASFLTQNLGIDWRLGAEYFEEMLNDFDVCSNWGNWIFAAGITGGRINVFNILKQSSDYDAAGTYVRLWLPELADVPTQHVHAPWRMSTDAQKAARCVIGTDYPAPLPDTLRGPASRFMGGGGGGGGGGRGGGGRGGGGGGRGGGRGGQSRSSRPPPRGALSEFERYG